MIFTLDPELTPEELAAIFLRKQWMWASRGVYGVPSAEDIAKQIIHLAYRVRDEGLLYARAGRLVVFLADESEGLYDVLLDIGCLWDESLDGEEDEVEAA
ncbi:hypothetical protein ACFVH6_25810 [Spirillospora sp. NPDC127200]